MQQGAAEDGPDQQREAAPEGQEEGDGGEGAALADPDAGRDQGDAGGQHDHRRLEQLVELGNAEVELGLQRRHADEEGAGQGDVDAEHGLRVDRTTGGARGPFSLDGEDPEGEGRKRGAADHLDVGRPPEGDVLAEQPVPHVVEGEAGEGDQPADAQQQAADGHIPIAAEPHRGPRRPLVAEDDRQDAGQGDARQADDDEPVGGVGQRPGVAAAVDVPGDVPVEAEGGGDEADGADGVGQGRPRGQAAHPLGELADLAQPRDALPAVADRDAQEQEPGDGEHDRQGDQVGEGSPSSRCRSAGALGGEQHHGFPPMRRGRGLVLLSLPRTVPV